MTAKYESYCKNETQQGKTVTNTTALAHALAARPAGPQKYPPERVLRGAVYHVGHGILSVFPDGSLTHPGNSR